MVGAEICAEVIFEVPASSVRKHTYTWSDHGFQLVVHEGALPPGVTATVAVRAVAGESFKLPEGSELVGAFYWITSTHTFQKEVTVYLQHCAVIENDKECECFKFLIGKCSQPQLPYQFKIVDGSFTPDSQVATVSVSEFSIFTIVYNSTLGMSLVPIPPPEPKRLYMAQVWYREESLTKYYIAVIITQRVLTQLKVQ